MTIPPASLSDFRILVHPPGDGDERPRPASSLADVAIPDGVSSLDVESLASNPSPATAPRSGDRGARALRFEPVSVGRRAALLMLTPYGVEVRVNDLPAPRLAVLCVADQLRVGVSVLHVSRFRQLAAGPPSPELLGRRCAVCRVPFDESTQVVVHDCGAPMHLEGESKPAGKRLECAMLGPCPSCEEPVVLESGFFYVPEF